MGFNNCLEEGCMSPTGFSPSSKILVVALDKDKKASIMYMARNSYRPPW